MALYFYLQLYTIMSRDCSMFMKTRADNNSKSI